MPHPLIRSRRPAARSILTVLLLAAALPLTCGSTAVAADMASPMANKAAAASPPPYQWTGCYAGANGGVGAASSNFNTTVAPGTYLGAADAATVSQDGSGSHNNSNALGGGQLGCNWQVGTIVVGLEGDYDYFRNTSAFYNNTNAPLTNGASFVTGESLTSSFLATVRPRLGIAADRNFAYVTAGVAFSAADYTESYADATPAAGGASVSKNLTGWVAGAGWEYAWTDHWIVRLEYLYAAFPNTTLNGTITTVGASNPFHGSADLTLQVVRGGLNFKF